MWKEKSESYPACTMLKENKAVEQATVRESWNPLLLVSAPAVPLFERKWAHSNCGFSERFILMGGRGSARVAGDICDLSSSTWLGTSPPTHGPLSEISMSRNSQAQYRLLLSLHDVYASHELACGLETRVIKNNHRSVQLWELPKPYILCECRKQWITETMQKSLQKNLPWSSSLAFQLNS